MDTSGSYLRTICQMARFYTDEVTADAKYSDSFLVNNLVYPAMTDVLARLNLNQDNPITVRHSVSLLPGVEYYQLPPGVQEVWRVAVLDTAGNVVGDWYPRGVMNPRGPGWTLEGNLLGVRPFPTNGQSIEVWYIPSGDVMCHIGTGYLQGDELVLAATPTLGMRDRRPNAYAGSILRILGETWQDRVIAAYDARTRVVRVRVPFDSEFAESDSQDTGVTGGTFSGSSTSSGGFSTSALSSSGDYPQTVTYEVAPIYSAALYETIAVAVALKLAVARKMTDKIPMLEREYRKAIKTITDNLMNLQMRAPKAVDRDTVDHPLNRSFLG